MVRYSAEQEGGFLNNLDILKLMEISRIEASAAEQKRIAGELISVCQSMENMRKLPPAYPMQGRLDGVILRKDKAENETAAKREFTVPEVAAGE